jgi:hypothetical protein
MSGLVRKSLDSLEETRPFESGKLELVNLEAGAVGRATFEPGWRWSKHVKPIAKTDSCQAAHMGSVIGAVALSGLQDHWLQDCGALGRCAS